MASEIRDFGPLKRKLLQFATLTVLTMMARAPPASADTIILSLLTFDGVIDGTFQTISMPGFSSADWLSANDPSNPLNITLVDGAETAAFFDPTPYAPASVVSDLVGTSGETLQADVFAINRNFCCTQTDYLFNFTAFSGSQAVSVFEWRHDGANVPIESFVGVTNAFSYYEDVAGNIVSTGYLTLDSIAQGGASVTQLSRAPVPEPSSLAIFAPAFFGLWLLRRRNRSGLGPEARRRA
jgi:hypothetical protein